MPTSSTPNPFDGILEELVQDVATESLTSIRSRAKREASAMDRVAKDFFTLFATQALNTQGAPRLGQYTPTYAALNANYAARKSPGDGFFRNTGKLQDDVTNLRGQTSNLMGHSSTWLALTNSGVNQGYSVDSNGLLRDAKGRFAKFSKGFKDFKVVVSHQPFTKLNRGLQPKALERQVFASTHDEIYRKLVNKGRRKPYRSAFYSFTSWWIDVYLRQVLSRVS